MGDDEFWADASVEQVSLNVSSGLSLVIDTKNRAGGFFDTMLAAAFGVLCDAGSSEAHEIAAAYKGIPFDEIVGYTTDDVNPSPYPDRAVIYHTPGWTNDGAGNDAPVASDRPFMQPAYRSVRVPLERLLSKEELAEVTARATAFAEENGITITGFRYVRDIVYTQSKALQVTP